MSASGTPRPPARFIATRSRKEPTTCRKSRRIRAASRLICRSGRTKKSPATSSAAHSGTVSETPQLHQHQPADQQRERPGRPETASSTFVARKPSNDLPSRARSALTERRLPAAGRVEAGQPLRPGSRRNALTRSSGSDEPRPEAPAAPSLAASSASSRVTSPGAAGNSARTSRKRPSPSTRSGEQFLGHRAPPLPERAGASRKRAGLSNRASRRIQAKPAPKKRGDHHEYGLSEGVAVLLDVGAVEDDQAERRRRPGRTDHDLHAAPGGAPLGLDPAAHVELLAGRYGERAEHVAQTGAAQPGVEDQGGDDQVGRGVVELVGEQPERVGQRHPGAQPVDERSQVRAERGGRGPDRGRDGLFQAGRAGDGVAQRLGPGGQPLQPPHRGALLRRAAGEAAARRTRGARLATADDRPAGQHEHHRPRRCAPAAGAGGQRRGRARACPAFLFGVACRRACRTGRRRAGTARRRPRPPASSTSGSNSPGGIGDHAQPPWVVAVAGELLQAGDGGVRNELPVT